MQHIHTSELPNFIVKSTLGVSITTVLILLPFTMMSFMQDRMLLGVLASSILLMSGINIWFGYQNKYLNSLNIFAIVILTFTACTALYQLGLRGAFWPLLIVLSSYFILPFKQAWIANLLFFIIITPIALHVLDPTIALRFFAVLLGISFFAYTASKEIYKQHFLLIEQSITDNLTGLYNRSLLQDSLENAINQSHRSNTPMAILMIDIDHFKTINDQFGHDVGDIVLKSTGEFLKDSFRASDMVFRIGGEEFLALIYNADTANAVSVAEKLRCEFEQLPLIAKHTITISIGVASLQADMDWKQWMKNGDDKLYQAKDNGRNQVVA